MDFISMSKAWLVREAERLQKMVERQELELQAAALLLCTSRDHNPEVKPPEENNSDACRSEFREIANNYNRFAGEGLYSWLEDCQVFVPDCEYLTLCAYRARSLRGYGHVLAVWDDKKNECLGWIKEENVTINFNQKGVISGRISCKGPNLSAPPRSEVEMKGSAKLVRVDTDVHHRLGLVRMEQTELVKCNSCGRLGMTVEESRDGRKFIICKCGEELEVVDDDE